MKWGWLVAKYTPVRLVDFILWLVAGVNEGSGEKLMRTLTLAFQLVLVVAMTQKLEREAPNAGTEVSGA